jgi:hypothetical protein
MESGYVYIVCFNSIKGGAPPPSLQAWIPPCGFDIYAIATQVHSHFVIIKTS